jgi:hypothetical protein
MAGNLAQIAIAAEHRSIAHQASAARGEEVLPLGGEHGLHVLF